jgi:hypothetical protein
VTSGGQAEVGLGEGGRVVDAVADHGHHAAERMATAQLNAKLAQPWSRRKHQVNGGDRITGAPTGCQLTVRCSRLPNFSRRAVSMSGLRCRLASSAASARSRSVPGSACTVHATPVQLRSVLIVTASQGNGPGGCSMQRMLVTAAAMLLTALAVSTAGCGGATVAGAPPTVHALTSDRPAAVTEAGAREAEVYIQVLRRYLSTPAENSFPGQAFKTVYVLNQAYPDAADPNGKHGRGAPIAPQAQRQVTAGLAGMAHVIFIADRGSVIEARGGCGQVRNGGILITLGPPVGHGNEVQVGINGWVACLGATWLTYVLQDQPGAGWRVTGTTGSMAIS